MLGAHKKIYKWPKQRIETKMSENVEFVNLKENFQILDDVEKKNFRRFTLFCFVRSFSVPLGFRLSILCCL